MNWVSRPDAPYGFFFNLLSTMSINDMQTLTFHIDGMTCGGCASSATKALDRTPGVTVQRLTLGGPATVELSGHADRDTVRQAIEGAGFSIRFDD